MSLKKENIKQYAKDYLKDKSPSFLSALNRTPQMGPLSKNPLLLQILCFVFDKQRLVLPTRRVELYERAVYEMLERRKPEIPSSIKEKVLQEIAEGIRELQKIANQLPVSFRQSIEGAIKILDTKGEPVSSKLEACLPIIPLFVTYKTELDLNKTGKKAAEKMLNVWLKIRNLTSRKGAKAQREKSYKSS